VIVFSQVLPGLSFFLSRQVRSTAWKSLLEIGPSLKIPVCLYTRVTSCSADLCLWFSSYYCYAVHCLYGLHQSCSETLLSRASTIIIHFNLFVWLFLLGYTIILSCIVILWLYYPYCIASENLLNTSCSIDYSEVLSAWKPRGKSSLRE